MEQAPRVKHAAARRHHKPHTEVYTSCHLTRTRRDSSVCLGVGSSEQRWHETPVSVCLVTQPAVPLCMSRSCRMRCYHRRPSCSSQGQMRGPKYELLPGNPSSPLHAPCAVASNSWDHSPTGQSIGYPFSRPVLHLQACMSLVCAASHCMSPLRSRPIIIIIIIIREVVVAALHLSNRRNGDNSNIHARDNGGGKSLTAVTGQDAPTSSMRRRQTKAWPR